MPLHTWNRWTRSVVTTLFLVLASPLVYAACSANDILLTFEEPTHGADYSAIGNIRGWAWARCGIDHVELRIDGELYGNIPSGGIRFDVPLSFPETYPGSANSGFSMAYNYGNLDPGGHSMEVRVIDTEGNSKSAQSRFDSNRFGQSVTQDVGEVDVTDARHTLKKNGLNIIRGQINGGTYDFELNWRDAVQGFMIENIAGRDTTLGASQTEVAGPSQVRSLAGRVSPSAGAWPATTNRTVQNNGIVLNFEEPVIGGGYTSISNIRGWAVSPAGMDRIELYMDGERYGEIPMGGTRRDVAEFYGTGLYPGADLSGFAMAYNYANLPQGDHVFAVRAYDNNGAMVESTSRFTISRFDSNYIKGEALLDLINSQVSTSGNAIDVAGMELLPDLVAGQYQVAATDVSRFNSRLEFDRASQTFKIQNVSQNPYHWRTGAWSDCTGSCGLLLAHRTRSVECLDSIGNHASDNLCSPPQPSASAACTACDTYTWHRGLWSSCSGYCGRGEGQQTRIVTCLHENQGVDDAYCGGNKPDIRQSCTACNTYSWYASNWSPCQGACGEGRGVNTRQVDCHDSSGEAVADSLCSETKPEEIQSCTAPTDQCEPVTYDWYEGSWGACIGQCGTGNGTQSRFVYCRSSEGRRVSDDNCSGAKPSGSRTCTASVCPTYVWYTGDWGECAGDCGTDSATQSRVVECRDSNGQMVADSFCSETKPASSQACTASVCPTYVWYTGDWGECAGDCGTDSATQSRVVECRDSNGQMVADSFCSETKPASSQACTASVCPTYVWYTGDWGECAGDCGTDSATQSRVVECRDSNGQMVADSFCSETKPASSQACTASVCPTYVWYTGDWGECAGDCGTDSATQSRVVECRDSNGQMVADSFCSETKPASSQACTASVCPTYVWYTGDWGECAGDCGADSATQSRVVECRDSNGQMVADSFCSETKPASSQACTASVCPTYSWYTGDWGECAGDCGADSATQSRVVECRDSNGQMVADSFCSETKPASSQACTASVCPTYVWYTGDWGECAGDCGADSATQSRVVECRDSNGQMVADSFCSETKPASSQACTASVCPTYSWYTGDWGECAGDCGTDSATQSRVVECRSSNGESVADYTCDSAKPEGTKHCTAVQCNSAVYWVGDVSSINSNNEFETRVSDVIYGGPGIRYDNNAVASYRNTGEINVLPGRVINNMDYDVLVSVYHPDNNYSQPVTEATPSAAFDSFELGPSQEYYYFNRQYAIGSDWGISVVTHP